MYQHTYIHTYPFALAQTLLTVLLENIPKEHLSLSPNDQFNNNGKGLKNVERERDERRNGQMVRNVFAAIE